MTPEDMATLIVNNIRTTNASITDEQAATMITFWKEISRGIIDHIKEAATVEDGKIT